MNLNLSLARELPFSLLSFLFMADFMSWLWEHFALSLVWHSLNLSNINTVIITNPKPQIRVCWTTKTEMSRETNMEVVTMTPVLSGIDGYNMEAHLRLNYVQNLSVNI
jgi:hypothetical protein